MTRIVRCVIPNSAPNRRWRWPFRCRGSRRESAVAQLFSLGSYARHMKDEQSEPPPLSERVFDYWFVTLPWIVCTGALVVFVGMPFARMLVVCWFKGTRSE